MEECGPHEHDVAGEEICATENNHYQPCGRERENVSLLLGGCFSLQPGDARGGAEAR